MSGTRRRWLAGIGGLVLILGAVSAYLLTRPPGQPRVSASALPIVKGARQSAGYMDCSKINPVSYDEHNPCQTFVLVQGRGFGSQSSLLSAEGDRLVAAGWHHRVQGVRVDWDGGSTKASGTESWTAPGKDACAYVTTVARGVRIEAKFLFPYDPYNQPHEVLDFYLKAKAAIDTPTLWIRLQPIVRTVC